MNKFGYAWPANLACHTFPETGDPNRLCIGDIEGDSEEASNSQGVRPQQPYNPASSNGDVDKGWFKMVQEMVQTIAKYVSDLSDLVAGDPGPSGVTARDVLGNPMVSPII